MRCKNCGWNNPDTAERCEKCNRPLVTSTVTSQSVLMNPRPMTGGADPSNKATRFDANMMNAVPQSAPRQAPPAPQPVMSAQAQQIADNKSTQLYAAMQAVETPEEPGNCPSCGYPLSPGATTCPMCGAIIGVGKDEPTFERELSCMDDEAHSTIKICSYNELSVNPGDIILIGGLRYQFK